jgi:hypothetical protein
MSTVARRSGSTLLMSVLAALFLSLLAGPAQAASYRYWGYYTWTDGAWTFASTGPDQTKPADGAVEGWRFAVTTESGSPRVPRAAGDFEAICASTEAETGKKRVAVVVDAGLPDDAPEGATPTAPRGACALVDESASGAQVLAEVATARVENNLICAIDDYPAQGCGAEVDIEPPATPDAQVALDLPEAATETPPATSAAASGEDEDGDTPWLPIALGAALVAAIAGAAVWKARSANRS